jgi:hypothetical protein
MASRLCVLLVVIGLGVTMASMPSGAQRGPCHGDVDGDGMVTIDEIVSAVNHALHGCPEPTADMGPTPTATPDVPIPFCQAAQLDLPADTEVTCLAMDARTGTGCVQVAIRGGDCTAGRACLNSTASCGCVGGPLDGVSGACSFTTNPKGIGCHGICTRDCVITIGGAL